MEEYLGRLVLLMDFSSSQILAVTNSTATVMTLDILIHLNVTHGVLVMGKVGVIVKLQLLLPAKNQQYVLANNFLA
jgi:hypothetical protein